MKLVKFGVCVAVFCAFTLWTVGCGPSDAQRAANAAEAAQAGLQYEACILEARKADGGIPALCACVRRVDAEHNIDGGACP